jgi:S1-C subfamily serine protease
MSTTLESFSTDLAAAAERAGRSVVAVHARRRIPASGVVWRPGVIVATHHTVHKDADVRVTLADGTADTMDFLDAAGTTRLGLVDSSGGLSLAGNFITSSTAAFDATMAMSGNVVVVTLGSWIDGTLATASPGRMIWRPSSAARDLAGLAASTAPVTEPGGNDRDF